MRAKAANMSRRGADAAVLALSALILLLFLDPTLVGNSSAVPDISVTAALDQETLQAPEIAFTLVNNAQAPVEIYESDLPWGIQASLSLAIFRLDESGTTSKVEPYYLIDDPGPGTIMVAAGATLTGRVKLSARFDGLEAADRVTDLLVRWRYVPKSADMVAGIPSAGWIVIPRVAVP